MDTLHSLYVFFQAKTPAPSAIQVSALKTAQRILARSGWTSRSMIAASIRDLRYAFEQSIC
jgi:hypothetical protein